MEKISNLYIFLVDKDKTKKEINILKPKTYEDLLQELRNNFENISEYYEIFIMDDNKEIEINNENDYKIVQDILFIREIEEPNINKSLFELNYNKLSESKQEVLDYKYRCEYCYEIIKNENPYFCLQCQNLFHEKCLKGWEQKCQSLNNNFKCFICQNELPLEKWIKKKVLTMQENKMLFF